MVHSQSEENYARQEWKTTGKTSQKGHIEKQRHGHSAMFQSIMWSFQQNNESQQDLYSSEITYFTERETFRNMLIHQKTKICNEEQSDVIQSLAGQKVYSITGLFTRAEYTRVEEQRASATTSRWLIGHHTRWEDSQRLEKVIWIRKTHNTNHIIEKIPMILNG